jgi:hypothetical protein
LVLWHFSIKRGINDISNFLLGKLAPIALLLNQVTERGLNESARGQETLSHVACHGTYLEWPLAVKVYHKKQSILFVETILPILAATFGTKAVARLPIPPATTFDQLCACDGFRRFVE